jgi:hypothetical protein
MMTGNMAATNGPRVLGPEEGELTLAPDGFTGDRFMIDGQDSGGGFALVEHRLAPHVLAAPLHLHTREDEYSYVLEGKLGALLGDQEVAPSSRGCTSSACSSSTPCRQDFSPASGETPSTSPTTSPRANATAMQRPVRRPEHCAPKAHHLARTQVRMHRPTRPARPRQLRRPGCDRRQQPAATMRPAVPAQLSRALPDEPGKTLPAHGRRQLILRKALPPAERGSGAPPRPGHISMI